MLGWSEVCKHALDHAYTGLKGHTARRHCFNRALGDKLGESIYCMEGNTPIPARSFAPAYRGI